MANDTLAPLESQHREPSVSMDSAVLPAPDSGLKEGLRFWGVLFACLFFRAVK